MRPVTAAFQHILVPVFLAACIPVNIAAFRLKAEPASQKKPAAQTTLTTTLSTTTAPLETGASEVTTLPQTQPATSFGTVGADYFSDALFIGDSRTEGLALYGNLQNADYFTSVGISVYGITEVLAGNPNRGESMTLDQKLSQRQYGKIYIMLGLNELATGTAQEWADAYAEFVRMIRAKQPEALIYVQGILHVAASADDPGGLINNASVNARNAALQQATEAPEQGIFYLDINPAVSDESGCLRAELTSDGIHLESGALHLWEDFLKENAILSGASAPADVPAAGTDISGVSGVQTTLSVTLPPNVISLPVTTTTTAATTGLLDRPTGG